MPQTPKHPLLSTRLAAAKPSPTSAMAEKAHDLAEQGKTIFNLSEGELDFDTPAHISDAGVRAIREGQTRYTAVAGTAELKAAIAEKFRTQNGLDYKNDEIIAACGAKQILFNAFLAVLNPGDEVIIPAPFWVSYPDMVGLADGVPVIVETQTEESFKLTPDALANAITDKTKFVVLNSPSNPTGSLYSRAELRALAEVLKRHPQILVMSDEIYEHIVFEGKFHSFAEAVPEFKNRTLTVNGVSKCYAMTGWRLGYAGGPAWLIRALGLLQSQSTSNPSSISQQAAVEALTSGMEFMEEWMKALRGRRKVIMDAIANSDGFLTAVAPDAAFYVYIDCSQAIGKRTRGGSVIETDIDFSTYLLEHAGVAVVPGTAFGLTPFVRVAFCVDENELRQACDAMLKSCAALK